MRIRAATELFAARISSVGSIIYFTIPKSYDTLLKTGIKREKSDCDRDPKATGFSRLSIHLSEKVVRGMPFLKRHWLYAVSLVALLCVAIGAFLAWRANQPVESKTVYVMPEPNPNRAEILKRITQPPRQAYVPKQSVGEATDVPADDTLDGNDSESSSQENNFEDEDLENMLAAIDEAPVVENGDFPPVPEGFLENNPAPVWLSVPGYQKGDMPEHETVYKVLIKLWNQGERGFYGGTYDSNLGKVYPLYPDVFYVTWYDATAYDVDGNPVGQYKSIGSGFGMEHYEFTPVDFMKGTWKTKYPDLKIRDKNDYGYAPESFLKNSEGD